jgi:hypothetical protein
MRAVLHRQWLFSFPQTSYPRDLLLRTFGIIYFVLFYGTGADTSFEYALSLPAESTAVVTK